MHDGVGDVVHKEVTVRALEKEQRDLREQREDI